MLGYKIATHVTHVTHYGNDIDGPYHMEGVKVLVVLDIPDDVKRTTPEMRYSKVPSGLTATELKEWTLDAFKYKTHPDGHALFVEFRNCIDKYGLGNYIHLTDPIYSNYIHVRKCRAAKAKVVKIINLANGTYYDVAYSDFDRFTIYQTGETVIPDAYTDDYLNICAHGIHYFESPEVAILYLAKDFPPSDASAFLNHVEGLLEKLRKGGDI